MPRYLVERHLPDGLGSFLANHTVAHIVLSNAELGVAWLCSYVNDGAERLYCLYEAASPEAIRKAARRTGLPIEVIHRVTVLDPHAFTDLGPEPIAVSRPRPTSTPPEHADDPSIRRTR